MNYSPQSATQRRGGGIVVAAVLAALAGITHFEQMVRGQLLVQHGLEPKVVSYDAQRQMFVMGPGRLNWGLAVWSGCHGVIGVLLIAGAGLLFARHRVGRWPVLAGAIASVAIAVVSIVGTTDGHLFTLHPFESVGLSLGVVVVSGVSALCALVSSADRDGPRSPHQPDWPHPIQHGTV